MTTLVAATIVFLATHFIASTPLRPVMVSPIGEWPYRGAYSLVALVTLIWMGWAYGNAPREMLWTRTGAKHRTSSCRIAFVLLACGYGRNPTMVGAEKLLKSEDPARGMIRITRHPIMWGIMLWAAAHIVARGDLKSLVFFGGLLALAAIGTLADGCAEEIQSGLAALRGGRARTCRSSPSPRAATASAGARSAGYGQPPGWPCSSSCYWCIPKLRRWSGP